MKIEVQLTQEQVDVVIAEEMYTIVDMDHQEDDPEWTALQEAAQVVLDGYSVQRDLGQEILEGDDE